MMVGATGTPLHVKPESSDCIYLQNTKLDDADKVSLSSPAIGDSAAFFTFKTGSSSYDWKCIIIDGTWIDGGPE